MNVTNIDRPPLANAFLAALLCSDGALRKRLVTIPDREPEPDTGFPESAQLWAESDFDAAEAAHEVDAGRLQ